MQGYEAIVVTKDTHHWVWPEPSPDGRFLAFHSGGNRPEDIYVSAADGSDVRQLTDDPAADRLARWSPDGRQIAFYSMRSGHWNIWIVNADGSGLRQATDFRDARLPSFPRGRPSAHEWRQPTVGEAFTFDRRLRNNAVFSSRRSPGPLHALAGLGRAIAGSCRRWVSRFTRCDALVDYDQVARLAERQPPHNLVPEPIIHRGSSDKVMTGPILGEGRIQMAAGGGSASRMVKKTRDAPFRRHIDGHIGGSQRVAGALTRPQRCDSRRHKSQIAAPSVTLLKPVTGAKW
jgi:hypothetical protein